MDQPPDDPLIAMVAVAVLMGSATTWFVLIARWRRGERFLEYEPRLPVPWGGAVAASVFAFVALAVGSAIAAGAPPELSEPLSPLEVSQQLVGLMLVPIVVAGTLLFFVTILFRPSVSDLGLPLSAEQLARDIWIGIVASLAAIAPVYVVQLVMLFAFGTSEHPLVEMVTDGEPNLGLILLASIAAVVVAPVCEEVMFRLLLQGWLEKWEDKSLRPPPQLLVGNEPNDDVLRTDDERVSTDSSLDTADTAYRDSPSRGVAGLPHGWFPIFASSLLFGLAHFGYGPDPIAIFCLAIILGYVYQRTHRIVPCLVAHALFNSLAMFMLWRLVFTSGE